MKNRKIILILFICCTFSIINLNAQQKLILVLQKGEQYKYIEDSKQKTITTPMGQRMEIESSSKKTYLFDIQKVDKKGIAEIVVKLDAMLAEMTHPLQGKITYDSSNPSTANNELGKSAGLLVGKSYKVLVDETGKVKKVEGIEALQQSAIKSLGVEYEKEAKAAINEENLTDIVEQVFSNIPEKSIKVGESWTKRKVNKKDNPFIAENTYTLANINNETATIELKSDVKPNPDAPAKEQQGMKITIDLNGVQNGSTEVNTKNGQLKSKVLKQNLSGTMKMTGGAMGSLDIPMKIESTTKIELVK